MYFVGFGFFYLQNLNQNSKTKVKTIDFDIGIWMILREKKTRITKTAKLTLGMAGFSPE